jgi:hypothetical protein
VVERVDAGPRRLDVHIGTIEIHPAEPVVATDAPPLQVAVPAADGGFADFLSLRTYEPWVR